MAASPKAGNAPKAAPAPEPALAPGHDARWLAGLAVGWVLVTALVGLGGDYSLNDDWCYL